MLATTATANARVVADVAEQLARRTADGGPEVLTLRGPLARPACGWASSAPVRRSRLAWLSAHLDDLPGSGIIYTLTVSAAEDLTALLRARRA